MTRRIGWGAGALLLLAGCPGGPAGLDAGTHPGDAGMSAPDAGDPGDDAGLDEDAGPACDTTCDPGRRQCDDDDGAVLVCQEVSPGCFDWTEDETCAAGARCVIDACVPCDSPVGTQAGLTVTVEGETRTYFLHVPPAVTCEQAAPLWVHFHGTASDSPEMAYNLDGTIAQAEAEGAILVRPRSRSSLEGGQTVYRWDQNPGDLERNVTYALALVDHLKTQYAIDPERIYASGFSSGSNMTSQFLGEPTSPFRGLAPIAGGLWTSLPDIAQDPETLRIYAATGYRDYLNGSRRTLLDHLDAIGYPVDEIVLRESGAGHEQYDWHFAELWDFFARNQRPAVAVTPGDWTEQPTLEGGDSVLAVAPAPGGDVVVTTAEGGIYKGPTPAALTEVARFSWDGQNLAPPGAPVLSDVCFLADGTGFAVGEGFVAVSSDGGATWAQGAAIPELTTQPAFGVAYLNGLGCDETTLVGGGYWVATRSTNGGLTWSSSQITFSGYPAQVMDIVKSPLTDTWVAVGSYTLGRSTDGGQVFDEVGSFAVAQGWINQVAVDEFGTFIAVGDKGKVLRSDDDGQTWDEVPTPEEAGDLFTVAVGADGAVAAAGMHGSVLLSLDGGQSFESLDTGRDAFVGALWFGPDGTLYALGHQGAVLSQPALAPND